MTKIQWAEKTWNPIVGCRRVSAGCENCYAEKQVHRGMAPQHKGLTVLGKNGVRWNGKYNVAEGRLDEPLRRQKPTTYFVNSLSDIFLESLPFELIAAIHGVMAACPQHRFQMLTKRPHRGLEFFSWLDAHRGSDTNRETRVWWVGHWARQVLGRVEGARVPLMREDINARTGKPWQGNIPEGAVWPLDNVHLGVSVEDQATADARIPLLLQLPSALPWVSYEPAIGPVDFGRWLGPPCTAERPCATCSGGGEACSPAVRWVVVGGESGPGARPLDLAWPRSTIKQCADHGTPCFIKQMGAFPHWYNDVWDPVMLSATKGDDMDEWPAHLRVREMPS